MSSEKKTDEKYSMTEHIVMGVLLVIFVAVWVAALISASRNRERSATRTADIIFAWASPLSYWILNGVGLLGTALLKE